MSEVNEFKPYGVPRHPTDEEQLTEEIRYLGYAIRQKNEDLERTKLLQQQKLAQLALIHNPDHRDNKVRGDK